MPSILLLVFLVCYVPFKIWRSRSSPISSSNNPYTQPYKPLPPLSKWVHYVYILLVVCLLGMRILEIARLIAASMGVGLLPVGIIAN